MNKESHRGLYSFFSFVYFVESIETTNEMNNAEDFYFSIVNQKQMSIRFILNVTGDLHDSNFASTKKCSMENYGNSKHEDSNELVNFSM